MGRHYFRPGARFKFHNRICCIIRARGNSHFVIEYEDTGETFVKSLDELSAEFFQVQSIQFDQSGPNLKFSPDSQFSTGYTLHADNAVITETDKKDEVHNRYTLLLPLMRLPDACRTRQVIEDYLKSLQDIRDRRRGVEWYGMNLAEQMVVIAHIKQIPSRATIVRWLGALTVSGNDIRALVPGFNKRGNPGQRRLDTEVEQIIQQVLEECAANPKKRTIKNISRMIIVRVNHENNSRQCEALVLPSGSSIYRRIKDFGTEQVLRRQRTKLEQKAEDMSESGPTSRVTRILERVEVDCTRMDIHLVNSEDRQPLGRPTLVVAIDVYSRYPLGIYIGFEPPNYLAVMQCLYHAICPKPDVMAQFGTEHPWHAWGKPEFLVIDNGKEFLNKSLSDACAQLGIILEQNPIQTPWYKGTIERHIGMINSWTHSIPGTTYSSPKEKGDYDSLQHASLTLEELTTAVHRFLLDVYAQDFHKGIQTSPTKRWQEGNEMFEPALEVDAETLRIILMKTEQRVIRYEGITVNKILYFSSELAIIRAYMRKQAIPTIRIKYDPSNLGTIYVQNPCGDRVWTAVPATNQNYADGLSQYRHNYNSAQLRSENTHIDEQALAATEMKTQQYIDDVVANNKQVKTTRKKLARLDSRKKSLPTEFHNAVGTTTDAEMVLAPKASVEDEIDYFDIAEDELDLNGFEGRYRPPL